MAEPKREEVEGWPGWTLLEFGASWCPLCQAARPDIDEALATARDVRHVMIEDGPGRRLGRSYRVKLWPTLVLLKDGVEIARAVRPASAEAVSELLARANAPG